MATEAAPTVYDFTVRDIMSKEVKLGDLIRGKVALVVNVASQCGFTGQYKGLEDLNQQYGSKGLVVLGFPCNQFGGQEPGNEEAIQEFVCQKFKATFPLMAKVEVNGDNAHPLYKYLKKEKPGILWTEGIKWNFSKFLIDREGRVVKRYGPTETPESIAKDVEKLL